MGDGVVGGGKRRRSWGRQPGAAVTVSGPSCTHRPAQPTTTTTTAHCVHRHTAHDPLHTQDSTFLPPPCPARRGVQPPGIPSTPLERDMARGPFDALTHASNHRPHTPHRRKSSSPTHTLPPCGPRPSLVATRPCPPARPPPRCPSQPHRLLPRRRRPVWLPPPRPAPPAPPSPMPPRVLPLPVSPSPFSPASSLAWGSPPRGAGTPSSP